MFAHTHSHEQTHWSDSSWAASKRAVWEEEKKKRTNQPLTLSSLCIHNGQTSVLNKVCALFFSVVVRYCALCYSILLCSFRVFSHTLIFCPFAFLCGMWNFTSQSFVIFSVAAVVVVVVVKTIHFSTFLFYFRLDANITKTYSHQTHTQRVTPRNEDR